MIFKLVEEMLHKIGARLEYLLCMFLPQLPQQTQLSKTTVWRATKYVEKNEP
jgi:hypothetical protein